VLGIPVHIPQEGSGEQIREIYQSWLKHRIEQGQGAQVITCNSEMIVLAQRDAQFAQLLLQADLVTPDGVGVVWALARQGKSIRRCPGIELAEALIQLANERHWRVAVIGGQPQVAATLAAQWQQHYPGITLMAQHGYFETAEEEQILTRLADHQPHLVLVGLGVPRQEFWIQSHRSVAPHAIWIGIGGSLDIWTGMKQRAPHWWRDHHLEWLYRLYQEPWRWRRMLALPQFAWLVIRRPATSP
jgi:N-acetylglucosaminyldiphosphoundecaprenol N-acetyl-beta-D-mannosaminyltransferase